MLHKKGEIMKKFYFIAVLTLTCAFGLGISARAQDADGVVVEVPFEFVAGGKTLPAGAYTVSRVFPESQPGLVIQSYDNSAFLLPIIFDGTGAKQATLAFNHVEDKYFLSKVETPIGTYTIGMPRAMTKVAQTKDRVTLSSSGTN
jgi:hypothetical protein